MYAVCVYVCARVCWCPWGQEEFARFPNAVATDSPVEEQQVLLIPELLQPPRGSGSVLSAVCRVLTPSVQTHNCVTSN